MVASQSVYGATKLAVRAISEGLRVEVNEIVVRPTAQG